MTVPTPTIVACCDDRRRLAARALVEREHGDGRVRAQRAMGTRSAGCLCGVENQPGGKRGACGASGGADAGGAAAMPEPVAIRCSRRGTAAGKARSRCTASRRPCACSAARRRSHRPGRPAGSARNRCSAPRRSTRRARPFVTPYAGSTGRGSRSSSAASARTVASPPGGQRSMSAAPSAIASAYGRQPGIAALPALRLRQQRVDLLGEPVRDRVAGGSRPSPAQCRARRRAPPRPPTDDQDQRDRLIARRAR